MRAGAALAGAVCLLGVLSTQLARGSSDLFPNPLPDVNGLFYGDGDYLDYSFLYGATSANAAIYHRVDGSTLYLAVVVSRAFNDNVYVPQGGDRDYVGAAGWGPESDPEHWNFHLTASDRLTIELRCGTNTWEWVQDYAYPDGDTYKSDYVTPPGAEGRDYDGQVVAGNVQDLVIGSSSSMVWNLNNSTYADRTSRSPDINANSTPTDEAYYDVQSRTPFTNGTTPWWEWDMVYEMALDISTCGTETITIWPVTAHNSPSKKGDEDNNITFTKRSLVDFGDLPDTYDTLTTSNGARHTLVSTPTYLGSTIDWENNGEPDSDAAGDDQADADDEDGIMLDPLYAWVPGSVVWLTATVTGDNGYLVGWFDWNGDGDILDAGEQIAFGDLSGTTRISLTVPSAYSGGVLYSRFRLYDKRLYDTDAGVFYSYGEVAGGEVEDYKWDDLPTSVTLSSFAAFDAGGYVLVTWATTLEINTVGFNIHRATTCEGPYSVVNPSLIPPRNPGGLTGAVYSWPDHDVEPGVVYHYQLEDMDVWGQSGFHGPVQASLGSSRRLFLPFVSRNP